MQAPIALTKLLGNPEDLTCWPSLHIRQDYSLAIWKWDFWKLANI